MKYLVRSVLVLILPTKLYLKHFRGMELENLGALGITVRKKSASSLLVACYGKLLY